ncbi:MAG: hypothetical protein R3B12_01100 [Candidatus Saccharimonadales bacterium]
MASNSAGTLVIAGALTVAGNTTLGDANTDTTVVRRSNHPIGSNSTYPLRFLVQMLTYIISAANLRPRYLMIA